MVNPIVLITMFVTELSYVIDGGGKYTVEEISLNIRAGNIVNWLEIQLRKDDSKHPDFSSFGLDGRKYISDQYLNMWNGYAGDEKRKWGIENNGLCLLISWGMNIILQLSEIKI